MSTTITVSNPSFDKVYTIQAWENNNRTLKLVQGEGITISSGATSVSASRVKAPRFQLRDKQGVINLSSGSPNITWAVKRPKGGGEDLLTCNIVSGQAANGIIEIPITTSVTEFAGDAYGEIRVTTSNGTIKFFGINACIGEGVSNNAAAQSARFDALLDVLQQVVSLKNSGTVTVTSEELENDVTISLVAKMDTLDSNGDLKTGSSGTNPVSSNNMNTYLKNRYLAYLKERFSSFKYAHEGHSSSYTEENPVDTYASPYTPADTTFEGVYIDDAIDLSTLYIVKSVNNNRVGLLFCASRNSQATNGVTQIRLRYTGAFEYRYYHEVNSEMQWSDWYSIETRASKDAYDGTDSVYFGITNDDSHYVSSKSVYKFIEATIANFKDVVVLGTKSLTPDKTYNVHKELVATYLSDSDYSSDAEYTTSALTDFDFGYENHGRPDKVSLTIPSGGVKIEYYDTVTGRKWTEGTTSGSISYINSGFYIQNLIPGHLYLYTIYDSSNAVLNSGSCLASGQVRMICAGGDTFNIRDLGGWTCDGGSMKYDKIYRGAELDYGITITSDQQQFMKDALGIDDDIDLRAESDIPGVTAFGLGVEYSRFPLSYGDIVVQTSGVFKPAAVIKHIAQNLKDGKTSYIHCRAGADRTATVCLLLEAICGVSLNDIDRDYELTSFSKQPNYNNTRAKRLRTDTFTVQNVGDYALKATVATINSMEGSSFQDKARRFLLRQGVTIDEINTIRFGLIDGTPSALTSPYGTATVTKSISNVYTDNAATTIPLYQPFEMTLTPNSAYQIQSVTVTMGGSTVTGCYTGNKISIPSVTGNLVITVVTSRIGAVGATYTLSSSSWSGTTDATQSVSLGAAYAVTENTRVDVDIDMTTLRQLQIDGCSGIQITTNTSGGTTTLVATAYGNKPTSNVTVYFTITEMDEITI